jgi:hypothetical protein
MMQLLAFWGRYAVAYCGLRSNVSTPEEEKGEEQSGSAG